MKTSETSRNQFCNSHDLSSLLHRLLLGLSWLIGIMTVACQEQGPHQVVEAPRDTVATTMTAGGVSYEQVLPIFKTYCSRCHAHPETDAARPDWQNQATALRKLSAIKTRVIVLKTMPQPDSPEARAITQKERDLLAAWIQTEENKTRSGASSSSASSAAPLATTPLPEDSLRDPVMGVNVLIQKCTSCHGVIGLSSSIDSAIPNLAGQNKEYLAAQLKAFRSGERANPTMRAMAQPLSDGQIEVVSRYFSGLEFSVSFLATSLQLPKSDADAQAQQKKDNITKLYQSLDQTQRTALQQRADICKACHLSDRQTGSSQNPQAPRLLGQNATYLENQLKDFKSGQRVSPTMNSIAALLGDSDEIPWLAQFFHNPQVFSSELDGTSEK